MGEITTSEKAKTTGKTKTRDTSLYYQKLQDERRHHGRVQHIRKKPKTKPLILANVSLVAKLLKWNITPVFGDEIFLGDYEISTVASGYLVLPLSFFSLFVLYIGCHFSVKLTSRKQRMLLSLKLAFHARM
ncbi:uncharacterized protein EV154DRAFT_554710 [Mucor mucedo]|uniref:uncharacterized protein n=1 Tax=Mucor mucedo TaxID=29922 RepID=UPI00221F1D93|nr:uncharacterized protein EV154DRAFT_554710 [Mucor mucedo]KAI7886231.1 hypothetical protein EV154DRAFT_554710 [Mucor mucedo]